ncbi:MAG: hypothetical protein SVM86_01580 [Candidatus Cloacimonadota bacterium]|nr:hypothetical protein [Candidatus Cloacimonadota bacterium]
MRKIILSIFIVTVLFACSLDHSNPLDVDTEPPEVVNINIEQQQNPPKMILTWNKAEDCDGYYIYRSQSYNGVYERIAIIDNPEITIYEDTDVDFSDEYFYFYRLSAYRVIGERKLEGKRTDPPIYIG